MGALRYACLPRFLPPPPIPLHIGSKWRCWRTVDWSVLFLSKQERKRTDNCVSREEEWQEILKYSDILI